MKPHPSIREKAGPSRNASGRIGDEVARCDRRGMLSKPADGLLKPKRPSTWRAVFFRSAWDFDRACSSDDPNIASRRSAPSKAAWSRPFLQIGQRLGPSRPLPSPLPTGFQSPPTRFPFPLRDASSSTPRTSSPALLSHLWFLEDLAVPNRSAPLLLPSTQEGCPSSQNATTFIEIPREQNTFPSPLHMFSKSMRLQTFRIPLSRRGGLLP